MTLSSRERLRLLPGLRALASIRTILFCLALSMALVVMGTLAQVDLGTFVAQKKFFNSYLIYASLGGRRVPVFPGGLAVGFLWGMSLLASLIDRFNFSRRNVGLLMSHLGLILLLGGQFLTQTFARESQMPIEVGQTLDYTENPNDAQLAVVMDEDSQTESVVDIPYAALVRRKAISTPELPFTVVLQHAYPNAQLGMASGAGAATQGVGARIAVSELPLSTSDDEPNTAAVVVEIREGERSYGTWLLSSGLGAPQSVHVQGKDYRLFLRPARYQLPFALTLKEFKHDIYPGTDIPKNFSSLVHLSHPQGHEERDALIYMNNPLRYGGRTFYQASFGKNDTLSVLQVVENPAWMTPYLSCLMVVLGLAIHFLLSLPRLAVKPS